MCLRSGRRRDAGEEEKMEWEETRSEFSLVLPQILYRRCDLLASLGANRKSFKGMTRYETHIRYRHETEVRLERECDQKQQGKKC